MAGGGAGRSGRPPGMCTQRISGEFQAAMMELGGDQEQWGRGGGERGAGPWWKPAAPPPMASGLSLWRNREAGTQWKLCFYISAVPLWSHSGQVDSKWSCNLKYCRCLCRSGLFLAVSGIQARCCQEEGPVSLRRGAGAACLCSPGGVSESRGVFSPVRLERSAQDSVRSVQTSSHAPLGLPACSLGTPGRCISSTRKWLYRLQEGRPLGELTVQ